MRISSVAMVLLPDTRPVTVIIAVPGDTAVIRVPLTDATDGLSERSEIESSGVNMIGSASADTVTVSPTSRTKLFEHLSAIPLKSEPEAEEIWTMPLPEISRVLCPTSEDGRLGFTVTLLRLGLFLILK